MAINQDSGSRMDVFNRIRQASVGGRKDEVVVQITTEEDMAFIQNVARMAGYRALCALSGGNGGVCIMRRAC